MRYMRLVFIPFGTIHADAAWYIFSNIAMVHVLVGFVVWRTNGFSIVIRYHITTNSTHATTVHLSFHVQNFIAITLLQLAWQQMKFPLNLNYDGKIVRGMGPRSILLISVRVTTLTRRRCARRVTLHGLTWIPAWISNHIPLKRWDEITYPFPK